jgi:glycosyltransferase involved in cell wall biosynthesis
MKIAIDITPIKGELKGHRVRGAGFYIEYLKRSLVRYFPENEYKFFTKGERIEKTIDIVHYPYFEPFFLTLPVAKRHKRIVTVHDLTPLIFPNHFPPGLKGNIRWEIQKNNLRRSEGILTDSFTSQKDIARITKIKKNKINVAYLAAAEEFRQLENGKWRQEILKKFDLPEKFVLYVGDVTWNKNIPRLIEAIREINLTLVIVGKTLAEENFEKTNPWNKDLATVQKMIENDKRFIRLGFVSTQDLVALYNIATVFVFPSIYEGFGLPILEAMQSGCPVVLSKEGCLTEVGGDAAYYVSPFNTNSIANGIGEVFFTGKLQKKLSEKGLKQAKKFSWKKTAEETITAYEKALKT